MASFAANPSIVSVPRGASPTSASRQPLQRMLDRRMLSVSTFVSSTASDTPLASQTAREFRRPRSTWPDVMPEAILFPANKPTSRADAQVLARWVSSSFQTYAKRSKQADSKDICEEDLTKMVQELVPVLSIGLNEVVRQVSQHCLERGVVLEKIWRTYVELFEQALGESREALRRQKDKTSKAEAELQRVRDEATELKAKHPAQLDKLRQTLTTKFDQRQNELVQQLTSTRSENRALKVHLEEQLSKQHAWFPMFAIYKESRYRRALLGKAVAELPKAASVEARLASDFRRILSSLPADVRRRVGFFISSLLGFRGVGLSAVTSEALQERKELNAKKIKELKAKLRQLQGQDTSESSEEEESGSQTEEANLANTCEVPDIPPATSAAPNNGADEGLVDPLADSTPA